MGRAAARPTGPARTAGCSRVTPGHHGGREWTPTIANGRERSRIVERGHRCGSTLNQQVPCSIHGRRTNRNFTPCSRMRSRAGRCVSQSIRCCSLFCSLFVTTRRLGGAGSASLQCAGGRGIPCGESLPGSTNASQTAACRFTSCAGGGRHEA